MDDCPRNTECVACAEINEDFAEDGENFAYFQALEKKVFPKSPFEHKNAYNFIKAVKRGAFEEVKSFLQE